MRYVQRKVLHLFACSSFDFFHLHTHTTLTSCDFAAADCGNWSDGQILRMQFFLSVCVCWVRARLQIDLLSIVSKLGKTISCALRNYLFLYTRFWISFSTDSDKSHSSFPPSYALQTSSFLFIIIRFYSSSSFSSSSPMLFTTITILITFVFIFFFILTFLSHTCSLRPLLHFIASQSAWVCITIIIIIFPFYIFDWRHR